SPVRSRPRRNASVSSATLSLTPSTNTTARVPLALDVDSFLAELREGRFALLETRRLLRSQHGIRLRELDVAVGDDLEPAAPRIAHVVAADAHTELSGGGDDGVDIVDDEPEVAMLAPRLDLLLEQGDELVAEVDERHPRRPAAQLQLGEQRPPEIERLGDAAHV